MDAHMLYGIVLTAVPILLSLSVHEFAHARTALAFGDPTAKLMGRCTLNPLSHLDPIGTLAMVFAGFGWAKPVPVNPNNLHPPRIGNVSVSLAGPMSNVGIAILCGIALRVMSHMGVAVDPQKPFIPTDLAAFLLVYTLIINLNLSIFNLIPLFPLDGHHIGRETVGPRLREPYMHWQVRYGMWVLMGLIIGPRLLAGTSLAWLDPLGWYFRHVLPPAIDALLGAQAAVLGFDGLDKFSSYLTWMK